MNPNGVQGPPAPGGVGRGEAPAARRATVIGSQDHAQTREVLLAMSNKALEPHTADDEPDRDKEPGGRL